MELLQQMIEFTANGNHLESAKREKPANEVIIKSRKNYDEDIEALSVFYPMEPGTTITIELQDLLLICERPRKRVDAFRGLVAELSRRGVVLDIKSRKSK